MEITKLKTLTILCCLLATTFVCCAQTFDENGFNTNPSATDNQYQEPTVINGVYQIANAGNLYWFADFVNQGGEDLDANAVLISDIVVNENLLSSLEKDEDGNVTNGSDFKAWIPMKVFKMFFMDDVQVTLDGNGKTISGLYVDDINTKYVGLFGEVAGMVFVSDLGIEDSYFKGESYVGGLVGLNTSLGTFSITNSYNAGTVSGSDNSVGGLVGYSSGTLTITNSYNAGDVSGSGYVGGLVGFNNEGSLTITNSFFLAAEGVSGEFGGTPKSANEFHIGLVALMLHNYVQTGCENDCIDGTIWGQNLKNGDLRPNFSSEINVETQELVLHTFDDDTRVYPTEYIAGQELPTGLTREGFVFLGWSSKEVAESSDDIVTSIASDATGKKEFYAQWKAFDDDGCFAIASTVELYAFANVVNNATEGEVCGTLAENIVVNTCDDGKSVLKDDGSLNCSGEKFKQWTPMNVQSGVQVTFNGNGKTISGLYFDNGNKENVGLFGGVYGTVDISNLNIVDSYFKGKNGVGGLVGYSSGENAKLSIANSYNAGSVSGTDNVGGLVGCGKSDTLTITSSYNAGTVAGRYDVGGLVGFNDGGTLTVTNSYNVGGVSGSKDNVGGLVGANEYFSTLTITNSYNAGSVSGTDNVGGLVGTNEYYSTLTIAHSFFLATGKSGDGLGGEVKTLDDFHDGTVTDLLNTGQSPVVWVQGKEYPILKDNHIHSYENGFCACGNLVQPVQDENGVYQIVNAGNLYWFADYVNQGGTSANAVLISDIVVNENLLSSLEKDEDGNVTNGDDFKEWILIGNLDVYYKGTFDGNGHTISGLYFNKSNQYNVGLFGQITGNAVIKNVGVIDSYFKGEVGVGGVCGDNDSSKGLIENCYNASIVIGKNYVGGVCGDNSGTITNCYNAGGIEGRYNYIGGVCGFSEKTIINCYNIGDIEGYYNTGGVCGSNESLIKNCYNTGEVNGDEKTGGVCGYNYYGTIQYCHNVGMVNSEHYYIGGVCGYNDGTIQHCYFNSDIYQGDASCGDAIDETVAGKSSADFKNLVIGLLNVNGNNVWGQGLSYPMLISNHVHEYNNGFCMVCNVCQQPEQDENDVYQIANAGNLYWFANYVNQGGDNANAFLANDIVVNENLLSLLGKDENGNVTNGANFKAWNPMGYYIDGSNYVSYAGTFDGNGHTISGLYFNDSSRELVGLFGRTTEGASIKNVGVVDSYFKGGDYVGGVCGMNGDTITNCYNTGEVNGSGSSVGGVCGENYGPITNCYNTGEVNGSGSSVGGVCGYNYNVPITNCYNTGEISGNNEVGGVSGDNHGTITNCYNTGEVNGSGSSVGGVCGNYDSWSTATNCYYLSNEDNGEQKTAIQFADGTVAKLLFTADSIWGQNTSTDTIPNFSGKILFKVTLTAENGTAENGLGEYNKKYEIKATANTGYHFVKWSNGSTKTNDTILVVSDTALVATFTAHEFGKWDTIQAATCTEYGLRVHTCSCGAFDIDTIPALGHSFTNYIYNNDATIEADGTETATCDHEGCHATDTRIAEGTKLGAAVNDLINENIHIYTHNYTIVVEHATNDIRIYDITGRLIIHRSIVENNTEQFNVENAGIYIVECGNTIKRVICN